MVFHFVQPAVICYIFFIFQIKYFLKLYIRNDLLICVIIASIDSIITYGI